MKEKDLNKYYENIFNYKVYVKNNINSIETNSEEEKLLKIIDRMIKNSENIKEECFNQFLKMANIDEDKIIKVFNFNSRFGDVFISEDTIYGKTKDIIDYFQNELNNSFEIFEDDDEEKEIYENNIKETIKELENTKEKYVVMVISPIDDEFHILDTDEELYEIISLAKESVDEIKTTTEKEEFRVVARKMEEYYFRIDLKDNSSCYVAITNDIESIARQDVVNEALNDNLITEGELDNIAEISAIAKTEFECMKSHNRNYPCSTFKELVNRILSDCNVGVNSKKAIDELSSNTKNFDKRENITSIKINNIKFYILGLGNEQFYITKNSNEAFNKTQLLEKIVKEKEQENEEEEL